MQFSVGDTIVHPQFGAGRITGVEHRELVEGFTEYFVIEIPGKNLTMYVPMRKFDELGIRRPMSRAGMARVLEALCDRPHWLPDDHKERQRLVREKLGSGSPIQVAEVVRDLSCRKEMARLTERDSALLAKGRDFLAGEMATVTGEELAEVKMTIDGAVRSAVDTMGGESKEAA